MLLASSVAFGDTIAKWTFETSQPAGTPGANTWITNISAEVPTGTAGGLHNGAATYSSPVGNGSSKSFSANTRAVGDCFQFAVRTVGFENIQVSFDMARSGTGPGSFTIQYSTDGNTFTQFGSSFNVLTNGTGAPTWNGTTPSSAYSYSFDLSSVSALNNAPIVYIRLVDATAPGGSGGTCRVDNFLVTASTIAGFPTILTEPSSKTAYWGDWVYLDVTATGTSPLSYRWYYPNMSSPLSDTTSGYGIGIITNTGTSSLLLTYVNTNQAGNYRVVVSNSLGSVTSQVAVLTVNIRQPIVTNIAYVRSQQDAINWKPIDTTNYYSVTGIVTTPINISGSGNSSQFFIQDGDAGICVFMGGDVGGTYLRNQGDLVRVTGPVANYNGLLEFNLSASNPSHSISDAISTGNALPTPRYFNLADYVNSPFMETNVESTLIVVSNVFLNRTSLQFPSGAMNITNANRKFVGLYVPVTAYGVIGQNVPRIAASIKGVMGQYTSSTPATGGYQLYLLDYTDLTTTTNVPSMPLYLDTYPTNGTPTNVVVSWWAVDPFTLQTATDLTGPYSDVGGATTPYTNNVGSGPTFYRLWQY
jgi:hypothetical protein